MSALGRCLHLARLHAADSHRLCTGWRYVKGDAATAPHVPSAVEVSRLLLWSFRYALGRRSTAPSNVSQMVIAYRDCLQPDDRTTILRDYDEARQRGELGDACDQEDWARMSIALRGCL